MSSQVQDHSLPDNPDIYTFDEFRVDANARRLTRAGDVVPLPSRVFDVLVYLIENRDRPVQKDEIITSIWNTVVVTDDSLIHAISVLRRTLADERKNPRYIETIPRRGYRFVGEVNVDPEIAEPGAPSRDSDPPRPVESPGEPAEPGSGIPGPPGRPVRGLLATVAGLLVVLTGILLLDILRAPREAGNASSVQLFQPPPPGMSIASGGVLSPDGRYLAFVARDDKAGGRGLWVRALQTDEIWLLEGTDGASKPFWSPNARRLGYFADGKLYLTGLDGSATQMIAPVTTAAGATWGYDGRILFAEWSSGLSTVPASGDGPVEPVVRLARDTGDIALSWPQFLPDSRHFLYQLVSLDPQRTGVYIGDLETGQRAKLLDTTSPATFAPPNYVLHVKQGMLIAEEIDPQWLELTGRAMVIARNITEPTLAADNIVSASHGLIAFEQGIRQQNLVWYTREGERLDTLNMPTELFNPRISPDGSQLLASSSITSNPGLWLASLNREEYARLENDAIGPVWSPDGGQIAFTSRGGFDMKTRPLDMPQDARLLAQDDNVKILNDWSPDGAEIVYSRTSVSSGVDLWRMTLADGEARPLLATPFNETQARLSPDGNWMAFASDESGRLEVYVAAYPGLAHRQQVSSNGGGQPQWRANQEELYYLSGDRAIMAVAIQAGAGAGAPMRFKAPERLFRPAVAGDPADARDYYSAHADGGRFLVDNSEGGDASQGITVIVNWDERLREVFAAP